MLIFDEVFAAAGPAIIAKDFGDELVVANLDSGLFYALNSSAGALWTNILAGHSINSIRKLQAQPVEEPILEAAKAMIERLLKDGVLVAVDAVLPEPRSGYPLALTDPPKVECFDDLQGLLLVDPIHDLSEGTWPQPVASSP